MRNQSIFASTKQIVGATASTAQEFAHLTTDVVKYARNELASTAKLSKLENTQDFVDAKLQSLTALHQELARVQALEESSFKSVQVELIQASINSIMEVN